jgi:hypothetical protein
MCGLDFTLRLSIYISHLTLELAFSPMFLC